MSMQDSLTIGYLVFAVCMLIFGLGILRYVLTQSTTLMEMQAFKEAMAALKLFDYMGVTVLVGSFVSSLYMSARVSAKPIYLPVSFIFLIIATFVAYVFTLIPGEMAESSSVVSQVFNTFGLTSVVLSNLHIFVLVAGLVGMIALYALQGSSGGGRRAPL